MSAGDGRPPSDGSTSAAESAGAAQAGGEEGGSEGPLARLRTARDGPFRFAREILINLAIVALVGLLLFAVSGVWPPMVAVESGSMEPHMHRGDLVFVSEPGRFVPPSADSNGVVTYREAISSGYKSFGAFGSVVVFDNPNRGGPPIIHRARFWVAEGENWYERANPAYMDADDCAELVNCPAPHAGYITKGDANHEYDQASGISGPVRPAWITGVAQLRVPYLGWVRLALASSGAPVGDVPVPGTPPSDAPFPDATAHARAASPAPPAVATPVDVTASPSALVVSRTGAPAADARESARAR
jgi:signal peptidase